MPICGAHTTPLAVLRVCNAYFSSTRYWCGGYVTHASRFLPGHHKRPRLSLTTAPQVTHLTLGADALATRDFVTGEVRH